MVEWVYSVNTIPWICKTFICITIVFSKRCEDNRIIHIINLQPKREGPRILQPIHYLPQTLVLMLWKSDSHLQTPILSSKLSSCLRSDPVWSETATDSATQHLTQHTALVMPYTQMPQRKCSDLIERLYT
jgi:hypothetical protein